MPVGTEFPDLSSAKRIAVDVETNDPKLKEMGAGVRRGGYIAGVAVSAEDADGKPHSAYYPVRHEQGFNHEPEKVMRYLADQITRPDLEVVGTNLIYDLDYLGAEGVHVEGTLYDVQVAEPIIDETKRGSYDLDSLSEHYLGYGKSDEELYAWLANAFGGKPTRASQIARVWRAPGDIVAPYGIGDTENPLAILRHQLEIIYAKDKHGKNLADVWEMERDLMPMLLAMKQRGVRIDVDAAAEANERLTAEVGKLTKLVDANDILINTASTIADYCDLVGIPYGLTENTRRPSFTKAWGEKQTNEVIQAIFELRRLEKSNTTFIAGILAHLTDGRVHAQFNQLPSDKYGAVSGRFSSSNPNLQNQPIRDPELGPLIRGLYIPDDGEEWGSSDYSQIEYRGLIHYAMLEFKGELGSLQMLNRFKEDPSTDVHREVAEMCDISRPDGKAINFGMVYGLGIETLMGNLGYPREQCEEIIAKYHEKMPFAKKLYKEANKKASNRGYIRTMGGRVRRFNKWEPHIPWDLSMEPENPTIREYMTEPVKEGGTWRRNMAKRPKAYLLARAKEEYPNCQYVRSHCHTALNALLQGSAADIMKRAMVDIWEAGICNVLGAPLLTVHDELNWSVPKTPEAREAYSESNRIMEAVYSDRLLIPLKVDSALGSNWAEAK